MEPLPRSWFILVSLCTILHGHGILAEIMARSWQYLGKASKELAMDLGKGTMFSNTGFANQIFNFGLLYKQFWLIFIYQPVHRCPLSALSNFEALSIYMAKENR